MKRYAVITAGLGLVFGLSQTILAQPVQDGPARPTRGERPDRPGEEPGRPRFNFPPSPILMVLDEDHDGELSESEINNAAASLRKLDLNKDGKLSREELRPFRDAAGGGEGGPGGRVPGPRAPGLFAQRLMSLDKDGDGKLSKEEVPERMQQSFDRIDTNKDGFIDRLEAEAMENRLRPRGGPRGEGTEPVRPEQPQK